MSTEVPFPVLIAFLLMRALNLIRSFLYEPCYDRLSDLPLPGMGTDTQGERRSQPGGGVSTPVGIELSREVQERGPPSRVSTGLKLNFCGLQFILLFAKRRLHGIYQEFDFSPV